MSSPFPASASLQKPVCVFCGSSPGKLPLFTKAAEAVGEALARANVPLVYGGGRRGIMGVVSQSALSAGGYVHGIVPNALVQRAAESADAPSAEASAQSKEGSGEEIVKDDNQERLTTQIVRTMHERKLAMAQLSTGGFIVLPGGYGTFEEALEMITWNQLGIHRLPVIILNIGGFYTNLYKQFESSVRAGFVAEENLALLKLVELEGGAEDEEGRAAQWGHAALKALEEWNLDSDAGLKLDWSNKPSTSNVSSPTYIFSTLRYTSKQHAGIIPLLETHLQRLREAFTHFSTLDPAKWGAWPGDEVLVTALKSAVKQQDEQDPGDFRVRWMVYPGGKVEVQMPPAPKDSVFSCDIPPQKSSQLRPVVLDPQVSHIAHEGQTEKDRRLYKTDQRGMYDAAYARGGQLSTEHPEVVIHNGTHLLETTTSNIAIQRPSEQRWITPRIGESTPLLNGVLRRYLLESDVIEEGSLTLEDLDMVKKGEGRLIGFNGLRGIWEGRIIRDV